MAYRLQQNRGMFGRQFKLIIIALIFLLTPQAGEAGPKEELFERLMARVMIASTDSVTHKSWFHMTNRAVTDVMTLEMQQAFRKELAQGLEERVTQKLYGQMYGKLLGNVRSRLMHIRPSRNFLTKVDRVTERRVSHEI